MILNIEITELYGLAAALLTTIAFIPQLYKTWKSQSSNDVSALTLVMFITGLLFWIIYGLQINSLPIIIANVITLLLNSSILFLKLSNNEEQ